MIQERIPKYVVSTRRGSDVTSAYCPYCRWVGIYPTMAEAQAAGLAHAAICLGRP